MTTQINYKQIKPEAVEQISLRIFENFMKKL